MKPLMTKGITRSSGVYKGGVYKGVEFSNRTGGAILWTAGGYEIMLEIEALEGIRDWTTGRIAELKGDAMEVE